MLDLPGELAIFTYLVRTQPQSLKSGRRFLVLLLVAAMPLLSRAEEQYKNVETTDLLKTPQRYWARPIVFKDVLTQRPENAKVDIEGKRYAAFSTRGVGVCYASADLLPAMASLEVNREYLFSGTVFQHRGRYVPVVQSYTAAMDTQKLSADIRAVAEETSDSFTNESVRPMADLLAAVQSAQVAYAKEKNIPLCQLYDPTSEHFVKAMDIARTAIYNSEQKNNTASAEILAQYLSTVLAKQCAPGSATQAMATVDSGLPPEVQKPPAQVGAAPAPTATNVAPQKLSWSERRAQTRARKEAERKEKKEREAIKAKEDAARRAAEQADKAAAEAFRKAIEQAAKAQEEQMKRQEADITPAQPIAPPAEVAPAPEAPPSTNADQAASVAPPKPPSLSWFQRWKMERQEKAAIKAELNRMEEESAAEARRLSKEKKAEEQRSAELRKVGERRLAEAKKLEDQRLAELKEAEARRLAEAKKFEDQRLAELKEAEARRLAEEKKVEEQRSAELKAEKRRQSELKEAEEQRQAEFEKAEQRRLAAMKEAEEQKRSEEKKAAELKKKQEAERLKAEAKKAKEAAAKKASVEKAPPPNTPPSNGNGIYAPVGR